jgi:microcystin-dependent protein
MASTFSPSLRIELIGDGDQSGIWGQTTNTNLGTLIEQAIAGVVTITMVDANYTMTNFNGVSDEARNQVLVLTGTNTAQRNLIAPLVEKTYTVKNTTTGGFAVQIIGSSGTGVIIPNGITTSVYSDGINFYAIANGTTSNFTVNGNLAVTGTTTLTGATTLSSTLAVTGATTFTGTPSGPTAAAGTNTTQLATTAFVQTSINVALPAGVINMWGTGTAPSGWLLCNGSAVNRTTYSALFAVISTQFGIGDGSTTFNLPNYQDRMPFGVGSIATFNGATGGSANAIVVSHTHTGTTAGAGSHNHRGGNPNDGGGSYYGFGDEQGAISTPSNRAGLIAAGPIGGTYLTDTVATHVHTFTTDSAGSSGTNANLPPYLGINFIIKT